jgi:hypothetical protein
MVTLCKKPQTLLSDQRTHLMLHQQPLFPLTQLSHTPHIVPQDCTQLIPGGDRTHISFRVSELKEIKMNLGITQKIRSVYAGIQRSQLKL